jgi:hypothetical protein
VCIVAVRDPSMWCATLIIVVFGYGPGARLAATEAFTRLAWHPGHAGNATSAADEPLAGLWLDGLGPSILFKAPQDSMVQWSKESLSYYIQDGVAQWSQKTFTNWVLHGFEPRWGTITIDKAMALGTRHSAFGDLARAARPSFLSPFSTNTYSYYEGESHPCDVMFEFTYGNHSIEFCWPTHMAREIKNMIKMSMISFMFSVGQVGNNQGGPASALLRRLMLLHLVLGTEAVCFHCRDTIPGCSGGDSCPLVADLATNTAIFKESRLGSTPKLVNFLPAELATYFPRPVCEAIVGIACAPAVGQEINFDADSYSSSQSVVQAALYGHCSVSEASTILCARLEAAESEVDVNKIKGAIDSLKIVGDRVVASSQGVLAFIWAKVSTIVNKRAGGTTKLVTASSKPSSSDLSANLVRPVSEESFFEMLHYFIMVILALGIATPTILLKFIDDVVWGALRMKESWKCAHELLVLYVREIDVDSTRTVHLGNVFRRGGQDTLLTEARRNVETFFRPVGGNPSGEGHTFKAATKPNGKFDSSSTKACVDYNLGRTCKKLKDDGTCQFNHKCNQFVTDKGPGGMCFGTHARCNGCDYDASKKCSRPSTQ